MGHVHAHVMGGVALLRRWLPIPAAAHLGVRAMVQMAYTLVYYTAWLFPIECD
jgi:hypothetical protein